ncbi:Secondary metabolism regulator LAE1 [Colletotrichum sidae]|uniref:Secondary metabolism regulator LAE1 n=1 Tax=Colletotrichum sidae TaxID=1347389 RepID=A0A4R8TG29_9PEZI|nr:Secondary metabolism regulator LAE1 [Colletotrichum sidae]
MSNPIAQQHEAEDTATDEDSSSVGDSSVDESLASLRSSILDYRKENGRTYHRLSEGKYLFPNDEVRYLTHHLWTLTWKDELCNSPKKDGAKRVLELGTGTGVWALDYAEAHPDATVIGVDLSPIQPGYVPSNCSFEVDDIEKEWTWSIPFDFIISRAMIGSFKSWPDMIGKAFDNLEPGGYLELLDNTYPTTCDDGTMTDESKVYQWNELMVEATDAIDRPITVTSGFKQMLEDAGFVDVVEKKEKWPLGPWPKDPRYREIGDWVQAAFLQGLEGFTLALFTRVLGWTKEETLVFCAEVRQELKERRVHGYSNVYCVYGCKPEKEASEAPPA